MSIHDKSIAKFPSVTTDVQTDKSVRVCPNCHSEDTFTRMGEYTICEKCGYCFERDTVFKPSTVPPRLY